MNNINLQKKILTREEYKKKYSEGIRKKLGKYNLSVQDLQRLTQISYYGIWKIVNGEAMPSLYNAYLITSAFKEVEDDLKKRGINI